MAIVKKKVVGQQKYLEFFGVKIPYSIDGTGENRVFSVGGVKIAYGRDSQSNAAFVKLFGKRVYLQQSLRDKHYRMRDKLTDEVCKQLLIKELTPKLGYKPNLDNPVTFNEKINWLKFNDRSELVTVCCDKYRVKEYVSQKIGEQYVLPLLGVWENPYDIDFDTLPDRFVLKVNWSSGYNIIVKDKSLVDADKIREQLRIWI